MTGPTLAVTWIVFVLAAGFLAENRRVTWPVAVVFIVAALFIAMTSSRGGDPNNRRGNPGG